MSFGSTHNISARTVTSGHIAATEYSVQHVDHEYIKRKHVVLLHGWMGSSLELHPLANSLAKQGYKVLCPDLPLHSRSINARPGCMKEAAKMLLDAFPELIGPDYHHRYPIAVVGYSLGGRIAQEMAMFLRGLEKPPFLILSLIFISCAPPPTSREDYEMCQAAAALRASAFRDKVGHRAEFMHWLRKTWYTGQMWGSIQKSPDFATILGHKLNAFSIPQRNAWAEALTCMGRDSMTALDEFDIPTLYLCGKQDAKYVLWSEVFEHNFKDFLCFQLENVGHNVLLQSPFISTSCICDFLRHRHAKAKWRGVCDDQVSMKPIKILKYSLPLKKEIMVNKKPVSRRDGILLLLSSSTGVFGIGDICPLPGLHKETVESCLKELKTIATRLSYANMPFLASSIDFLILSSITQGCSPITQNGIECAFIHLLSCLEGTDIRFTMGEFIARSHPLFDAKPNHTISVNGVLPRTILQPSSSDEVLPELSSIQHRFVKESVFRTLKLKVGSLHNVEEDAKLTIQVAISSRELGKTLRLDANRAWTRDQFEQFESVLGEETSFIHFIEEPLQSREELSDYLRENKDTSGHIPIALDESLADGTLTQIKEMAESKLCSAFVVKPSVIGSLHHLIGIADIGRQNGCEVIMSSVFESGVGCAWVTLLAGMCGRTSTHGLGTYMYLKEDIISPGFGEFCGGADKSSISLLQCQKYMKKVVEHVEKHGTLISVEQSEITDS